MSPFPDSAPGLPVSYPRDLQEQTRSIISKAVEKFPSRGQVVDRCKYLISELTPLFVVAIRSNQISALLAEFKMAELLHSLVTRNWLSTNSASDERKLRRSEEWFKLLREIRRAEKYAEG